MSTKAKGPSKEAPAPAVIVTPTPVVVEAPALPPAPAITTGSGRFVYDDGSIYEGDYKTEASNKTRHGTGRFAGQRFSYKGGWHEDVMHGEGVYVGASGTAFTGAFDMGDFHGQGQYRWADGSTYTGQWVRNKMHGAGQYVSADGLLFAGEFYAGLYVNGSAHVAVR